MTCIVVFLQATLIYHTISQSLDECNVMIMVMSMMMTLIVVPFIAFRAEGRGSFFLLGFFFPSFSPFCLFFFLFLLVAYAILNDSVTNSAPKPMYLGLHFRLMFQICMHCLHFSGIWMLVPCSRNSTLISKIIMGLVTTWDMNLCIKFIGLSHLPALVLLYCVCVRVCDVRLPRKTSEKNLKSRPSFLHAVF